MFPHSYTYNPGVGKFEVT